jgi:hypothetical protein
LKSATEANDGFRRPGRHDAADAGAAQVDEALRIDSAFLGKRRHDEARSDDNVISLAVSQTLLDAADGVVGNNQSVAGAVLEVSDGLLQHVCIAAADNSLISAADA